MNDVTMKKTHKLRTTIEVCVKTTQFNNYVINGFYQRRSDGYYLRSHWSQIMAISVK